MLRTVVTDRVLLYRLAYILGRSQENRIMEAFDHASSYVNFILLQTENQSAVNERNT